MNIGIIGSVKSTEITLRMLVKHNLNIVGVLGFDPINKENISGWVDLERVARELNIPYDGYEKINDRKHINWMKDKQPDIIFAVGFSQLLSKEWLDMPSLGCIGFHPTALPKGRGRAPLAWIVLEERRGAASFFLMSEDADDGPIFIQEFFELEENDDAKSTGNKISRAMESALEKWIPLLKKGEWNPISQDEAMASWYGKRTPIDGVIDWKLSANQINLLIKASTHPHPGAYTFFKDTKVTIWESSVESETPIKGVVGRILISRGSRYLVQCGEGLLWIEKINSSYILNVGDKLGYSIENEIYKINKKLSELL
jgi:Methionyl-tRNA formyltransferase